MEMPGIEPWTFCVQSWAAAQKSIISADPHWGNVNFALKEGVTHDSDSNKEEHRAIYLVSGTSFYFLQNVQGLDTAPSYQEGKEYVKRLS